MRSGRVARLLVVVWAVAGLGACGSPPARPLVAVHEVEGQLQTVGYLCPHDVVVLLRVVDRDSNDEWETAPPVGSSPGQPADQIVTYRVFETPPGWEVHASSLKQVSPERRYRLTLLTLHEMLRLDFTTKDVDGLGGGQVLVGTDRGQQKMSRAQFERGAKESCPKDKETPSKLDLDRLEDLVSKSGSPTTGN